MIKRRARVDSGPAASFPSSASDHTGTPTMASAHQAEARAKFLQEAAHLLAVSSPTTAAFIGRARNSLVEDAELEVSSKESDAYRRGICGACGNVMIPGWSCKVSNRLPGKSSAKHDNSNSKGSTKPGKRTCYTCLRCHRETQLALQQRPRRKNKKFASVIDAAPAPATRKPAKEIEDTPKTLNASSKQRQKARKGGLQALLDKKKTEASSAGGLDLMDFAM